MAKRNKRKQKKLARLKAKQQLNKQNHKNVNSNTHVNSVAHSKVANFKHVQRKPLNTNGLSKNLFNTNKPKRKPVQANSVIANQSSKADFNENPSNLTTNLSEATSSKNNLNEVSSATTDLNENVTQTSSSKSELAQSSFNQDDSQPAQVESQATSNSVQSNTVSDDEGGLKESAQSDGRVKPIKVKRGKRIKRKKGDNLKHLERERNKNKYKELCAKGLPYEDVIDEMQISPATLTKYAIETNTVPFIKNFDRQQLYQILFELSENKRKYHENIHKKKKRIKEKRKRTYDPDIFLN